MISTLLISAWIGASSVSLANQSVCPADHERIRDLVSMFLTSPFRTEERERAGVVGYRPDQVRVLTDASDGAACEWFASKLNSAANDPRWRWAAYQVGDRYFVSFRYFPTDGSMRMGFSPLLIFDLEFNQVAGIAA